MGRVYAVYTLYKHLQASLACVIAICYQSSGIYIYYEGIHAYYRTLSIQKRTAAAATEIDEVDDDVVEVKRRKTQPTAVSKAPRTGCSRKQVSTMVEKWMINKLRADLKWGNVPEQVRQCHSNWFGSKLIHNHFRSCHVIYAHE